MRGCVVGLPPLTPRLPPIAFAIFAIVTCSGSELLPHESAVLTAKGSYTLPTCACRQTVA